MLPMMMVLQMQMVEMMTVAALVHLGADANDNVVIVHSETNHRRRHYLCVQLEMIYGCGFSLK